MTNITSMMENGANITVAITLEDLRRFHQEVNPSSLWRWRKRGYLVPAEIGGKRRYKMSDIRRILNGRAAQ